MLLSMLQVKILLEFGTLTNSALFGNEKKKTQQPNKLEEKYTNLYIAQVHG